LFGWLTDKFYKSGLYANKGYRAVGVFVWLALIAAMLSGVNFIARAFTASFHFPTIAITLSLFGLLFYQFVKYYQSTPDKIEVGWKEWAWIYFWAIFTHPLLDSCTTFGTQLFQPFSDYRVAFNNIAVADPTYTVPFTICLIVASILTRKSSMRRFFNWLGIGLSSAYLLFTFYNKHQVNKVFEAAFAEKGIEYHRYTTSPTIFSNALWQGVAEGDSVFYQGMYSTNDRPKKIFDLNTFPKNHHLIEGHENDEAIQTLKWFSNNYYNITDDNGTLHLNDLRFGTRSPNPTNSQKDFVFSFRLEEKDGVFDAHETRAPPENPKEEFRQLFDRIKGIDRREKEQAQKQ